MKARFIDRIDQVSKQDWNDLVPDNYPFAKHQFLYALEESGCVGGTTGWTPRHLIIEDDEQLLFAMPLYEKEHSYGEYVFDWQWASAFERYGRHYYPKLLTAIPFTPATGPRLLAKSDVNIDQLWPIIQSALAIGEITAPTENTTNEADKTITPARFSSWHILFVDTATQRFLSQQESPLLAREDVQFHWKNHDSAGSAYTDFDHFLAGFRSSKRKQIKRERRKISEQGLRVIRRTGSDIQEQHWQEFYQCYKATYLKRSGHSGYLNQEFFQQVAASMAEHCMLVSAYTETSDGDLAEAQLAACSLFFFDDKRLYGRYWGALSDYDCLHFEACYYQGIEFAIEKNLSCFDPGTQGEHKLVRGFEPTKTFSYHWVGDTEFAHAIDNFLKQERQHTQSYQESAARYLPFHRDT